MLRYSLKIRPSDKLSSSLSDLGVEDRVVSEGEPPKAGELPKQKTSTFPNADAPEDKKSDGSSGLLQTAIAFIILFLGQLSASIFFEFLR